MSLVVGEKCVFYHVIRFCMIKLLADGQSEAIMSLPVNIYVKLTDILMKVAVSGYI